MSDLSWRPVTVTLSELQPWARNPRRLSKKQAARLLQSWDDLGQFQTIAIGPGGEVYDGHQRLSVLKAAHGNDYTVQALQASRALTEAEREALTILAQTAAGSWDWDALAGWDTALLQSLGLDADLLAGLNDDAANLREMLNSEKPAPVDAEPQIDRAEELREKWGVEPGQLWRLGRHSALCADAMDIDIAGSELVVTDPPYDMRGGDVMDIVGRFAPRAIVLCGDRQAFEIASIWRFALDLIWVHRTPRKFPTLHAPLMCHTHCVIITKPGVKSEWQKPRPDYKSVIEIAGPEYEDTEMGHGKAAGLFVLMMEGFKHRAIADPFMGTGAVVLACESSGRTCVGVEKEPSTLAVALERFRMATGIEPVLASDAGRYSAGSHTPSGDRAEGHA